MKRIGLLALSSSIGLALSPMAHAEATRDVRCHVNETFDEASPLEYEVLFSKNAKAFMRKLSIIPLSSAFQLSFARYEDKDHVGIEISSPPGDVKIEFHEHPLGDWRWIQMGRATYWLDPNYSLGNRVRFDFSTSWRKGTRVQVDCEVLPAEKSGIPGDYQVRLLSGKAEDLYIHAGWWEL